MENKILKFLLAYVPLSLEQIQLAIEYLTSRNFLIIEELALEAKNTGRTDLLDLAKEMYKRYVKSVLPDIEDYVNIDEMQLKEEKIVFVNYLLKNGITGANLVDPAIDKLLQDLGITKHWFLIAQKQVLHSLLKGGNNERKE
ncbi:MAG: hypothetical protein QXP36_00140 [Conexivisphaerales archaeon]